MQRICCWASIRRCSSHCTARSVILVEIGPGCVGSDPAARLVGQATGPPSKRLSPLQSAPFLTRGRAGGCRRTAPAVSRDHRQRRGAGACPDHRRMEAARPWRDLDDDGFPRSSRVTASIQKGLPGDQVCQPIRAPTRSGCDGVSSGSTSIGVRQSDLTPISAIHRASPRHTRPGPEGYARWRDDSPSS